MSTRPQGTLKVIVAFPRVKELVHVQRTYPIPATGRSLRRGDAEAKAGGA